MQDRQHAAVDWLYTPRLQTMQLGLERITELLARMGQPQDALKFVHVAGSNGKGSTCAYVAQILREAGYRVGLFTSPALVHFGERIQVNGDALSLDELDRLVEYVRPIAEALADEPWGHPTEFELMTAVGLQYFAEQACDIVVLEVGLGGRLDATNIIESPEVSIITRMALDHTDILGDTLAAVAAEKAGIIKRGCPVVSWPQEPEAYAVIEGVATAHECPLFLPDFSQLCIEPLAGSHLRNFTYKGIAYTTRLIGTYQPANATLAIECMQVLRQRGWDISDEDIRRGIALTRWPGRFEVFDLNPLTIIDGGHNSQGARALIASLEDLLGDAGKGRVTVVMSVLADKDYPAMVRTVLPWAKRFVVCEPPSPRALSCEDLADEIHCASLEAGRCIEVIPAHSPVEALVCAQGIAEEESCVVAFGSLYTIGEIMEAWSRM